MKDKNTHRIVFANGMPETENFKHLNQIVSKNPGITEGLVNGKFTPFPKIYKKQKFECILGIGQKIICFLENTKSGLVWKTNIPAFQGEKLNGKIMAWRQLAVIELHDYLSVE